MITEVSKRTFVRKRLNSIYNSSFNKEQFYVGICSLNDNFLRKKNFTEVIEYLHSAEPGEYKKLYEITINV